MKTIKNTRSRTKRIRYNTKCGNGVILKFPTTSFIKVIVPLVIHEGDE